MTSTKLARDLGMVPRHRCTYSCDCDHSWELDEPPTRRERQATFADHAILLAAVGLCVTWALAAVQGIVTWIWG